MQSAMEGPLSRHAVSPSPSPFPSLPFLTDAYLPGHHAVATAAHQQQPLLLLQSNSLEQGATPAATDRLSASAESWCDPSGAAALHLLGGPRDGDGAGELLSGVQDPTPFAASCFGSYLCSPYIESPQGPEGPSGPEGPPGSTCRSFSPLNLAATPDSASSNFVGAVPSGGFSLYYGPSFPFSLPNPLACGVAQDGSLGTFGTITSTPPQQNTTQETQGFASDYDRLTRELGRFCASLRDIVTDNPSSAELNSTLETAIGSADQVSRVQRKLLLSGRQQQHLVADSKLIHSKVYMLHRILQKTAPRYSQLLAEHPHLQNHIEQLEHHHRDPVGYAACVGSGSITGSVQNCTMSHRNNSSISTNRRRSVRQYKRQQTASPHDFSEGMLLPTIKTEPTSSCA
ncbi:uncharacterized protein LOC34623173 [Cyclospora cayetanensis]|uniref:Uncharacterized protein LOC34623173 n=2 Tax=Cyclospora cayetanensis TaxID=88456 RepID=A0A6P5WCB3_9EIME|nr:uncharacterized protein LOC34623173 [Cyclospora cayetanensis]OEH74660.1 hypothetical protein cyc_07152 [Cyclospora cayetanensis]